MTTACILVAAGRGDRLGPGPPKALRGLAGEPLVVHAARAVVASGAVDVVVVAAPGSAADALLAWVEPHIPDVVVVAGGAMRRDSVAAGLAALPDGVDVVLVHDAARCLTPPDVFGAVAAAVQEGADAVVPVLPVADTVKHVEGDVVVRTLDRSVLRAVQTPQGFRRDVLIDAHRMVPDDATDDAALVEKCGVPVHVVAGHDDGFKITRPIDLVLADAVLARRRGEPG